jgi:hypothetical protein
VPKKRNQPSNNVPVEKIDFPAEDQAWMAVQTRVIELTAKPIEDLEWNEIETVSQRLSPSEQDALRKYWFRLKSEQENQAPACNTDKPSTGVPKWANWEDQGCDKTFEWIVGFQQTMRAVIARLLSMSHPDRELYAEVLIAIKKDLVAWLEPAVLEEVKGVSNCNYFIACNVSGIFPTDEGRELLQSIYDRLEEREKELEQQRQQRWARAITGSPVVDAPQNGQLLPTVQRRKVVQEPKEERMTLSEAYALNGENNTTDIERSVLAAALMLEHAAESGNRSVSGQFATGISDFLKFVAADLNRLRGH